MGIPGGNSENSGRALAGSPGVEETTKDAPPRAGTGSPWSVDRGPGCDDGARKGDKPGRYVLCERVGSGGMGSVWKARDQHDRLVAIKFLRVAQRPSEGGAQNPSFITDEFTLPASIRHPGIIWVEDVGRFRGSDGRERIWVAMEFIADARTLTEWLTTTDPHPIDRLERLRTVASALEAAHSIGPHLDVKPDNILIDANGDARLIDFGIARRTLGSFTISTSGTPEYCSPEQQNGRPIDGRTDSWAFGIVLYEALTGVRPLSSDRPRGPRLSRMESALRSMFRIGVDADISAPRSLAGKPSIPRLAEANPSLYESIPHLLGPLDLLVERCLNSERSNRPDGREVRKAVEQIIDSHRRPRVLGVLMQNHPGPWRWVTRAAASLVAAAIAWALSTILSFGSTGPVHLATVLLPPPAGSVADRGVLQDVLIVRITGNSAARLESLPAIERVDVARAAPSPDSTLRDLRPWLAEAMERVVAAGAASVLVDIILSRHGEPDADEGGTRRIAHAVTLARERGVPTTVARSSIGSDEDLEPLVVDAEPHSGHFLTAPSLGGSRTTDAAIIRDERLIDLGLAAAAVVALHGASIDDLDVGSDGLVRVDPQSSRWVEGKRLAPGMFSGRRQLDPALFAAGAAIRDGDHTCFSTIHMPPAAVLESATIDLERLLAMHPDELEERVGRRTIVFYRGTSEGPGVSDASGPIQAVLFEDMLNGTAVTVTATPSIWLSLLAGFIGSIIAVTIAPRLRDRRYRRAEPALLGGIGAMAFVMLLIVILAARGGFFIYPLPAIVTGFIAPVLVLHGPRTHAVLKRFRLHTHHPPPFISHTENLANET